MLRFQDKRVFYCNYYWESYFWQDLHRHYNRLETEWQASALVLSQKVTFHQAALRPAGDSELPILIKDIMPQRQLTLPIHREKCCPAWESPARHTKHKVCCFLLVRNHLEHVCCFFFPPLKSDDIDGWVRSCMLQPLNTQTYCSVRVSLWCLYSSANVLVHC